MFPGSSFFCLPCVWLLLSASALRHLAAAELKPTVQNLVSNSEVPISRVFILPVVSQIFCVFHIQSAHKRKKKTTRNSEETINIRQPKDLVHLCQNDCEIKYVKSCIVIGWVYRV